MKGPSKEDMLNCFDGMCTFLAVHGYVERDERAVAIRKLIEEKMGIPDTSEREAELEQLIIKMQEQLDKKPKVTKKFVEKWLEEFLYGAPESYPMIIKAMLKEAGLEVE